MKSPAIAAEEELELIPSASPLWMITQNKELTDFVEYLTRMRSEFDNDPSRSLRLEFSRTSIESLRQAFARVILSGEQSLHSLARLLSDRFFDDAYQLRSVVIGEVVSSRERFTLIQNISHADLFSTTDLDLGTRQLKKLQFADAGGWSGAQLVANMVDYQPLEPNGYGIHKLITRIKAEEEIWNKVVDEIFDIDSIVLQDKKLRHLSRYVKDIFGLKIVVGDNDDVFRVQSALAAITWNVEQLQHAAVGTSAMASCEKLQFIEVKNYLARNHRKRSGWEAMKSVVLWGDKLFEFQIQPLRNYLHERELLTKESHASFKAKREQVRDEIANQFPLFGFYRSLLQWLFVNHGDPAPQHPAFRVVVTE